MRRTLGIAIRVLPVVLAVVLTAGGFGERPHGDANVLQVASGKPGAGAVNSRAAKGGSVAGKAKPGSNVNGGKR
jgi:hypothetical protein